MPEFLSDEWIAALDAALSGLELPAQGMDCVVVEQVVRNAPGRPDERRFQLVIGPEGVAVRAGAPDRADLRLHLDYGAACALARGETNAQRAIAEGCLRVEGDLARLGGRVRALGPVPDVFATLRADTTFAAAAT